MPHRPVTPLGADWGDTLGLVPPHQAVELWQVHGLCHGVEVGGMGAVHPGIIEVHKSLVLSLWGTAVIAEQVT